MAKYLWRFGGAGESWWCQHGVDCETCVMNAFASWIYLLLSGLFGICAFLVLSTTLMISMLLLPLCCLGLLVGKFAFLVGILEVLVDVDAAMVNYLSPNDHQILIERPPHASSSDELAPLLPQVSRSSTADTAHGHMCTDRVVSNLRVLSIDALVVVVYFMTIRLVMAAFALFIAMLVAGIPITLVYQVSAWHSIGNVVLSMLCLAAMWIVAVGTLDLLAHLCSVVIRHFCCDPLPPVIISIPTPRTRYTRVVVVRCPVTFA